MSMLRFVGVCIMGLAFFLVTPDSANAQFGKIKDKIKKEAEKKVPKAKEPEKPKTGAEEETESAESKKPADSQATGGDSFQLYTKFDFVPGQRVLFYDDLSREEMGEFPSRWSLKTGVFEIAKAGPDAYIMASSNGQINPKINVNQLPEKYTVEFDFLNRTSAYQSGYSLEFHWLDANGSLVGNFNLYSNTTGYFYNYNEEGSWVEISNKQIPSSFESGVHQIRIMVTKSSIKCYVDNERLVNAPKTSKFAPASFAIAVQASATDLENEKLFFRNFRFAEGGKTMREQLDEEGHIVTHGIYFDVNSDKIRGESYKTLADIAQMLTDDAALKLMIEGHTDSDGADASNLDLSERRAKSVRQYLIDTYKVGEERLESKGLGETKPIDANTTPEGKANNRRVELAKI